MRGEQKRLYPLGDFVFKKKPPRALYALGKIKNICPVCPTWGVCPISGFSLSFSVRFVLGLEFWIAGVRDAEM
jgi:hypothetical protein